METTCDRVMLTVSQSVSQRDKGRGRRAGRYLHDRLGEVLGAPVTQACLQSGDVVLVAGIVSVVSLHTHARTHTQTQTHTHTHTNARDRD